jgi:uncharacterized protein (DUF2235 family)
MCVRATQRNHHEGQQVPRNIIICFDGTSNEFGTNNTNVVRLVQALDCTTQRVYYDPGVGTLPEPGRVTRAGKAISQTIDLGFGTGIISKVEAAYAFLMDAWETNSHVFLFGFSRGAYTARVLAGLLHGFGLLAQGNNHLIPYVMRLYRSIRGGTREPVDSTYWRLCNSFRTTFARRVNGDRSHLEIHLLGLWDTVSSVGWAWEPATFLFTAMNPSVMHVRHAVSIDEHRAFFRTNLLNTTKLRNEQDWREMWFPGVHADVGGGYPERDGGLWLVAFDWMIEEARSLGLIVNDAQLEHVRNHSVQAPREPWAEPAHESLAGRWKLAEYFPKRRWDAKTGYHYRSNRAHARSIPDGALIHESALKRIRANGYRPPNFSDAFVSKVRALDVLPQALPYQC